ncbi:hypothetical protein D1869_03750 [Sulfurisphaera ohwakuensis]|uniref:Uncharacterized protein n=2 Tax=Sulfurisphaera ohwakuensis TaxID=69656 RepID=A0A650CF36_SULOH|nr:hypothetical protein [Sulfurisphaera ohwakuensis]QGR16414.1 hypothetical protein D1869_03750 [Sulfurisphaera ohwakuensis]
MDNMNVVELVELVSKKRREMNKEKLEEEIRRTLNQLSELRDSIEKLKEIKTKMILCSEEINDDKKSILQSNDPDYISSMVNLIYQKVNNCYKKIEEERRIKIEEQKRRIREINEKLIVYKKIFKNIFNENIDVHILSDKLEDLDNEIKKGEDEIERLNDILKSRIGSNLELLVKLIENNEIEIDQENLNEVIELTRFLVNKGLILSLRFSK